MPIGLDWGTSTVIACRNVEQDGAKHPRYIRHRNCYVAVDATDFWRNILTRSEMSYVELPDDPSVLYVVGDDAINLASTMSKEIERPMSSGVMQGKPKDRQIMQAIAKSVLKEPKEENEVLVYSLPSDPVDADFKTFHHKGVANAALTALGYSPRPIPEALATVYSEAPKMIPSGEDKKPVPYTGIGMSFGGGMVNACVAFRGFPTIQFSLANAYGMGEGCAGDWIDKQIYKAFAGDMGSIGRCTLYKEQNTDFTKDLNEAAAEAAASSAVCPGNKDWHYEVIATTRIFYESLLDYVIDQLVKEFNIHKPAIDGALEIVIGGGTTLPNGFEDLLDKRLRSKSLPFRIAEVKKAAQPERAVARGSMGAAEIGYE